MPKTAAAPVISEAVTLLTNALTQGHTVSLSLVAAPYVNCPPPLAATLGLAFKLTHAESVALAKLLEGGGPVGRETLRGADSKAAPGGNGVDVLIHHLRKKLESHGIAIATIHKQGFALDEDGHRKIRTQLDKGITSSTT